MKSDLIERLRQEAKEWDACGSSFIAADETGAILREAADALSAFTEALPLPLLQRLLAELRRWKSCQSIGACRQCVDDGVILQLSLVVEQALRSPQREKT